ncbi:hypothetical protein NQ318_002606 [Aromia moschata]|uniref:Uncharacterized protein n=1 Tax=Aromia moschata TaxID=1265417 RepID=A0AAV8XY60_9CUCU|nr:hypothetical protein NQ318_002606 [Aromia moschata]
MSFGEFVGMEKNGHRYVIQYFHLTGLSPTNIKVEPDSTLSGESDSSFTALKYWPSFSPGLLAWIDLQIYRAIGGTLRCMIK